MLYSKLNTLTGQNVTLNLVKKYLTTVKPVISMCHSSNSKCQIKSGNTKTVRKTSGNCLILGNEVLAMLILASKFETHILSK